MKNKRWIKESNDEWISRNDDETKEWNKMMKEIKLPHDTILYRNVRNLDHIPEVGETFVEKGFISTSINNLLTSKYGGKQIKIYAEKGVGCIPNEMDLEILLKENSTFKVLSKTDSHAELLLRK